MTNAISILVADPERTTRESLAAWLKKNGYAVDIVASGREAAFLAQQNRYSIYFLPLKMAGPSEISTMKEIFRIDPDASVVITTPLPDVDNAIAAIKDGAEGYVVKPYNPSEVLHLVNRILELKELQCENLALRAQLKTSCKFCGIISKNKKMQEIFGLIERVANRHSTVLIEGESGTGKELVARAIHSSGCRASKPFIAISCAALTETLLESELFGHEKGAYTGALSQEKGKFELADAGTILLDEIGDISPRLQLDLLRVMQERSFYRIGGSKEIKVDVRILATTNVDLWQAVCKKEFRSDLYFRLNVVNIRIPPLRMRRDDIPLLTRVFLERNIDGRGKAGLGISLNATKLLMDYDWPGNIRELENAIERAVINCSNSALSEKDFNFLSVRTDEVEELTSATTLREIEKQAIIASLKRTHGNLSKAAMELGIDRSTLYHKLSKHNIGTSVEYSGNGTSMHR